MTVRTIDDIFRDFVIDGVPASGPFNPHKPDIRDTLKALTEGGENFPDNRVIRLNNADGGTANNIVVTASVAIPAAAYQVLYILNVTHENTGAVAVSGAINRTLVTNTSRPIEPGYLQPGMALLCVDTGAELRLLSYGDAEAILSAAEDAANRAEAAAAGLNLPPILPGDVGKSLVVNEDETGYQLVDLEIRPEMFGARGDGVTDDTDAIAQADAFCRSFSPSKWLVFGAKTYLVSQMVIHPFSKWKGQGKDGTIIRQIVGSNRTLIYGLNSEENFPLTDPTNYAPFPYDFEVDGFDLDGNWNDGAGNISGHGFFVLGDHYNVRNLYVRNCAECGVVKKFVGDHPDNYDSRYLETSFKHIRVDYVGKHGFLDFGPHDSLHEDIIVLDAGQSTGNTFDGFNHNGSSSRNIAIHAATRSGRERMRYAVSTWNGSMNEWSGGSNIEGAETANLGLFSSGNQFDPSTRFYAAWGGVNIALGGASCTLNIIRGALQGPANGRPACIGVKFSSNSGDVIAQNDIDLLMSDQDAGAFQFDVGNKGGNRIRAKVYTTANVGVFGAVNPLDEVLIRGTVNANSRYELNNMEQSVFLASIPAGGSYTWTFPYEFRQNPNVQITPTIPSAALTLPLWVSELSPTSVTIFNPNSNAEPVNVLAKAVY